MCKRLQGCFPLLAISLVLIWPVNNEGWADSYLPLRVNGIVIDVRESTLPDIVEQGKGKGERPWIVLFDGPVREADRERVIKAGCRLLDYLPDFAFLAVMDSDRKKEIEKLPFIAGVARFKPSYKLTGHLREKADTTTGEQVRLHLKLDDAAQPDAVIARVHQLNGKVLGVGRDTLQVATAVSTAPPT